MSTHKKTPGKVKKTGRKSLMAATMAAALVVTSCSDDGDGDSSAEGSEDFDVADGIETSYDFPNVPEGGPPADAATLGDEDQEIGEVGEDPNLPYTSDVVPIEPGWMVAAEGKDQETVYNAFDPETGEVHTRIVTGNAIWDNVVHVFSTEDASEPQATAFEVWKPRGSRGQADYTVSTYSGDLLEPEEVNLPKHVRFHSREGSHTITQNGKYMASWDDQLFGIRVVDLDEGLLTGELQIVGCGPFTWSVEEKIYSLCETDNELLELTIDEDGGISETGRSEVLPEDFTSARESHFSDETNTAFLVNEAGDVYLFDFSEGLPSEEIQSVGNIGKEEGRFHLNEIRPDGEQFFAEYTDSDIHPVSANGGDVVSVRLFNTADAEETQHLTLEDLGLDSIDSASYSLDGSVLYVLGGSPEGDDEDGDPVSTIVGVDPENGEVVSTSAVTGHGGDDEDLSGLFAPERQGS